MAFNVRFFGHQGTRQLQQVVPQQFTSTISEVLVQPYIWSQVVTTNGAVAVNTALVGNGLFGQGDAATIVMIEVPDGQNIRYEVNIPTRVGGAVVAGNVSPRLSGVNIFAWQPGTIFSIVEAATFP